MKKIMIDFRIRAQVEEVIRDGVDACWEWIGLGGHCVVGVGLKSVIEDD